MKLTLCVVGALLFASVRLSSFAQAPTPAVVDGSDVDGQLGDRQDKIVKLSLEEQLKLRAAQQKAAEDPAVKAALDKRNQAIEEFRKAMHDSMVKSDPKMEEILQKIAVGLSPGF
jgi:hypothetical protein